jgi:hypothetical protein
MCKKCTNTKCIWSSEKTYNIGQIVSVANDSNGKIDTYVCRVDATLNSTKPCKNSKEWIFINQEYKFCKKKNKCEKKLKWIESIELNSTLEGPPVLYNGQSSIVRLTVSPEVYNLTSGAPPTIIFSQYGHGSVEFGTIVINSTQEEAVFTTSILELSVGQVTIRANVNGILISAILAIDLLSTATDSCTQLNKATRPGPCTLPLPTATGRQITVNFTNPVSDGGSPILFYTLSITSYDIPPIPYMTTNYGGNSITVTGLANSGTYNCNVWATNIIGKGNACNCRVTIGKDIIEPVTNAVAQFGPTIGSVKVTFTPSKTPGITSYVLCNYGNTVTFMTLSMPNPIYEFNVPSVDPGYFQYGIYAQLFSDDTELAQNSVLVYTNMFNTSTIPDIYPVPGNGSPGLQMRLIFDSLPFYDTYTASISLIGSGKVNGIIQIEDVDGMNQIIRQTVPSNPNTNIIDFNVKPKTQTTNDNRLISMGIYEISSYVTYKGNKSDTYIQRYNFRLPNSRYATDGSIITFI